MTDISDEEQDEIDKAWDAALEVEWRMKSLENELTPAVRKAILKNYANIFLPDFNAYNALESMIWKHVDRLVRDVNHLANSGGQ